jgi:hypothetical protein
LDNEWYLRSLLFYLRRKPIVPKYSDAKTVIDELENNRYLMNDLKKDILLEETGIDKLIELGTMKTNTDEYNKLYNQVIQVGEYRNP